VRACASCNKHLIKPLQHLRPVLIPLLLKHVELRGYLVRLLLAELGDELTEPARKEFVAEVNAKLELIGWRHESVDQLEHSHLQDDFRWSSGCVSVDDVEAQQTEGWYHMKQ
jgi:hypothetical protein